MWHTVWVCYRSPSCRSGDDSVTQHPSKTTKTNIETGHQGKRRCRRRDLDSKKHLADHAYESRVFLQSLAPWHGHVSFLLPLNPVEFLPHYLLPISIQGARLGKELNELHRAAARLQPSRLISKKISIGLILSLKCDVENPFRSKNLNAVHGAVSYTHLTLPTIYSV